MWEHAADAGVSLLVIDPAASAAAIDIYDEGATTRFLIEIAHEARRRGVAVLGVANDEPADANARAAWHSTPPRGVLRLSVDRTSYGGNAAQLGEFAARRRKIVVAKSNYSGTAGWSRALGLRAPRDEEAEPRTETLRFAVWAAD